MAVNTILSSNTLPSTFSRPSTFLHAAGIASFGPNDTYKNPNWKTVSDHRDVRLVERNGKWIKIPWIRQDSFYDVLSSGFRPNSPDSIQIKGSFQQRKGGSLLTKNTGEHHLGTPPRIRREISSNNSNRSVKSVEKVEQVCDSIDRIIGEWKYVLQNNGNSRQEHKNMTNTRKYILSRAHSVPILTNYEVCSKNKNATKNKHAPRLFAPIEGDKAMSEINEKDLEHLPIEFVELRKHRNTNELNQPVNKRREYLEKAARIGKRAGLNPKQMKRLLLHKNRACRRQRGADAGNIEADTESINVSRSPKISSYA